MAGEHHKYAREDAAVLAGSGLACRRGGRLVFTALDLELISGELLLLRGPNGSGKSTLLRLIAGLIPPEHGVLLWRGKPIRDVETYRSELAYLGHADATKSEFTPAEDLRFWLAMRGVRDDEGRISAVLKQLDLEALAELPCRLLSAGQRRRVALARVVVSGARLWLLDEPFNALDEISVAAAVTLIAEHRATGGVVILAAHGALPMLASHVIDLGHFSSPEVE